MVRVWEFFGPVTIQLGRIQTNRYVFAESQDKIETGGNDLQ
jgi:hypothetical protein